MKQILCLLILIGLFNFLKASAIIVCQQNEGICCVDFNFSDSCQCVTSPIPNCNVYWAPCKDNQRLVLINTDGSSQNKCID